MAGYGTNDEMHSMYEHRFDSIVAYCGGDVIEEKDEQTKGFEDTCKRTDHPKLAELAKSGAQLCVHIDPTGGHDALDLMMAAIEKHSPDVVSVEPIFDHEAMEEDHQNVLLATDDKGEAALYLFMVEDCNYWYNLSFVGMFYLRDLDISLDGLGDALNDILRSYDSDDDILPTGPIARKHTPTKDIDLDESWTAAGSIEMPCRTPVVEFRIFSLLKTRMLECHRKRLLAVCMASNTRLGAESPLANILDFLPYIGQCMH